MSTTPTDGRRVVVYPVAGRYGTSYKAEVKGPGTRVYVGTLGSEAAAIAAGEEYKRTGRKPVPAKRGPKGPRGEEWEDVPRTRAPRPPARPKPATSSPARAANHHLTPEKRAMLRAILARL